MIVRHLDNCRGTSRQVRDPNWNSVRMLLASDNVGFSFHITTIYSHTETPIQYNNHFEAVYCISGNGSIEQLATSDSEESVVYPITPGTLYVLDQHDKHILRGDTEDMVLACVFNPPLTGLEVHDENRSYPLLGDA